MVYGFYAVVWLSCLQYNGKVLVSKFGWIISGLWIAAVWHTGWAKKVSHLLTYFQNLYSLRILWLQWFLKIYISQGSVATQIRCGGIFSSLQIFYNFITNFPQNVPVKKIWKSVNIWHTNLKIRNGQKNAAYFFGPPGRSEPTITQRWTYLNMSACTRSSKTTTKYSEILCCLDNDDSDRTIEWSTAIFSHSVHRPSPIAMRLRSHEAVSSHHATDRRVKTLETTQRYDLDVKLWKTNINASPTHIELYIENARDYAFSYVLRI